MESSSSNSKERELQQMQLEETQLHSKCVTSFKELKSHLGNLHKFSEVKKQRPFEIAFRIFFHEEHQTFIDKIRMNATVQGMNVADQGMKTEVMTMKATVQGMMQMLILDLQMTVC
ncbi:hypothetical protein Tco_0769095 [Tanacetum coccineum]|uniref:Uncharacterized protein n=1 Tax=Tanacetum coccineum TaxID=301880 RepID=A0ABQ4Z8G6_9ASTR